MRDKEGEEMTGLEGKEWIINQSIS